MNKYHFGIFLLAAASASASTTYTVFDAPYSMGPVSDSLTSLFYPFETSPSRSFELGAFVIRPADESEGSGVLGFRAVSDQTFVVEITNTTEGAALGVDLTFQAVEDHRYVSFDYQVSYTGPVENLYVFFQYYVGGYGFAIVDMLGTGTVENLYLAPSTVEFFNEAKFFVYLMNPGSVTFEISNFRGTAEPVIIPEPASAALIAGLGLLTWVGTRRRR